MGLTSDVSLDPGKDPFWLLGHEDQAWDDVDGVDLVDLAIRLFQPDHPAPLAALLRSGSPLIRRRGLLIFGRLGARASGVIDDALRSAGHEDVAARSHLMDGLIHKPRRLSADQVRIVLGLAADPDDLVRGKVVVFLREVDIEVLGAAIAGLEGADRGRHEEGRDLLASLDRDPQALFDEGAGTTGIRSTYCLAAVERMARSGLLDHPPRQKQDSWMGEGTLIQVRRLSGRARKAASRRVT